MNVEQAKELLKYYKDFPPSGVFSLRPINYPMFHILECFCKGWEIQSLYYNTLTPIIDIDFERMAHFLKSGHHDMWKLVARNPGVTNSTVGFVQEDLYSRYVGKCNPLKTPYTSWTYIPLNKVKEVNRFGGVIGNHTKLYAVEIDLDTTDVTGEWSENVPWHYLQQTINWKPWQGRLDWQGHNQENQFSELHQVIGI